MKVIDRELSRDFETLEIYILADTHIGDKLFDRKLVDRFIKHVLGAENRYVIINGDIVNNATKSSISFDYAHELSPDESIDYTVELLKPIKDRILVATEGNHEARTARGDGILLIKRICRELGIEHVYSQGAYLLFVSFGKSRGRDDRYVIYTIYGKHGSGGGTRIGSKANKLEDMFKVVPTADIFVHSHTHEPISFKTESIESNCRYKTYSIKEHLFVNSSAFLSYGGYAEEKGYRPVSTSYPRIILSGTERRAQVLI